MSSFGRDHVFVVVEGAAVAAACDGAAAVGAVRYAFADWPVPIVRNQSGGLPAHPLLQLIVMDTVDTEHTIVIKTRNTGAPYI